MVDITYGWSRNASESRLLHVAVELHLAHQAMKHHLYTQYDNMGALNLVEWQKLPISLSELCINTTLRCGQSFRYGIACGMG